MTETATRDAAVPGQRENGAPGPELGSMCFSGPMNITLRDGVPADATDCGRICHEAFTDIALRHGYKSFFPTLGDGVGLMSWMLSTPGFHGVVAEADGRIVGSGALQEWDKVVAAIAVISVDPTVQGRGVGEQLMRAMLQRAAESGFVAVRLAQAAYNRHSFSLYAKLGFSVRELLVRFNERPQPFVIRGYTVRPATLEDASACNALCMRVHGHERSPELCHSINEGTARVVEHDGQRQRLHDRPGRGRAHGRRKQRRPKSAHGLRQRPRWQWLRRPHAQFGPA